MSASPVTKGKAGFNRNRDLPMPTLTDGLSVSKAESPIYCPKCGATADVYVSNIHHQTMIICPVHGRLYEERSECHYLTPEPCDLPAQYLVTPCTG